MKIVKRIILTAASLLLASISTFWLTLCWSILSDEYIHSILSVIRSNWTSIVIGTVVGLFMFGLSVFLLMLEYTGIGMPKSFCLGKGEEGSIHITEKCLRQLCETFVLTNENVRDICCRLTSEDKGLVISLRLGVVLQVPVPMLAYTLQDALHTYIEKAVGVPVASISILVDRTFQAATPSAALKQEGQQ